MNIGALKGFIATALAERIIKLTKPSIKFFLWLLLQCRSGKGKSKVSMALTLTNWGPAIIFDIPQFETMTLINSLAKEPLR
jgi:hypothetical protein